MIFPNVVVAGGRPEVEFQESRTDATDATSYTFSGMSFGAEKARRNLLVFAAFTGGSSVFNPTTVTVGGASATYIGLYFWIVSLPTGTSGSVVLDGPAALNATVAVWSLYKFRSATPVAAETNPPAPPVSIDAQSQGFVFGVGRGISGTTDVVWSGLTEDDEINTEGGFRFSFASERATTTAPVSVDITLSGSGGSGIYSLISLR